MAIKKYFIDNVTYGVDAMNKIVSSLRTTGIDGEIADCLKVTKASALSVYIAPGRGWVDGCQIELDATETRAVSATAGTYSVIMQLSKTGTQTDDIDIVVIPGSETGTHVLAHVTVSGNAITAVTDVRNFSRAIGNTTVPVSIQSGVKNFSGTISAGKTITLLAEIPGGAIKANGFITENKEDSEVMFSGKILEFSIGQGLNYLTCIKMRYISGSGRDAYWTDVAFGTNGELTSDNLNRASGIGSATMPLQMSLTASGLVLLLKNPATSAVGYNFQLAWEAWNYDTI